MIPRFVSAAALAFFVLAGISCDKHSWDDTSVLFKHGGAHGDSHGHAGDDHGKHGEKADKAHGDKH